MTEKEWVELIAPYAINAQKKFGYLASVLIAQTIQQTGYGQTDLAQPGRYNILGMKKELLNDTWRSDYWHGGQFTKITPEWTEDGVQYYKPDTFRTYNNYQDCLYDYCEFMRDAKLSNNEYKYRDVLGTTDTESLIYQVRTRGYCTDPTYDKSIMAHIQKWDLTRYDNIDDDFNGIYIQI